MSMSNIPPTMAPSALPADKPRWPGWIGGTAIAFAVLTLVVSCCQSVGLFGARLVPMVGLEMPAAPRIMAVTVAVDTVVTLVLAAVLLTGAVGTLRHRQSGVRGLRRFAVARLVLVVPLLLLSIAMVRPSVRWAAEIAGSVVEWKERKGIAVTEAEREATRQQEATPFQLAMSVAWPLAGGAYPLFLILFLRRPEVAQEVERWDA
ncbi:MAG: hypothetical protein FJ260_09505 [Planctomycetes bacterium]|nr:hypothetical protein [Planctomycetota bacterium]